MLWLLEPDVFGPGPHPLLAPARCAGHRVLDWDDDWWASAALPPASEGGAAEPVVFHGSLANAARIAELGRWRPGSLCAVEALACSRWYPRFTAELVHRRYSVTTVRALCEEPIAVAGQLANPDGRIFVRPDSPLKPFSGRVVSLEGLTPAHLDHGFYFDDLELPIIVAPVQTLGPEWRFVIVGGRVVADSGYIAEGRRADVAAIPAGARALAEALARSGRCPGPTCVLDLGEVEGELRVLEFNPFSGADLYACDLDAVVSSVGAWAADP